MKSFTTCTGLPCFNSIIPLFKQIFLSALFITGMSVAVCSQPNEPAGGDTLLTIRKASAAIAADSTLRVVRYKVKKDTVIAKMKTYRGSVAGITVYYDKEGILRRLSMGSNNYSVIYGGMTDYYFDQHGLLYVTEKYIDRSRMGSCGELDIENRLYYWNGTFLKSEPIEEPFACYGNKVNVSLIEGDLEKVLTALKIRL